MLMSMHCRLQAGDTVVRPQVGVERWLGSGLRSTGCYNMMG